MNMPTGSTAFAMESAALRADNERLREALRPFADYADQGSSFPDEFKITFGSRLAKRQLTIGDCRRAREALK